MPQMQALLAVLSCALVDMVVSGVPRENGILHASEIASMALDLVGVCCTFRIPHKPNTQLQIRAGIHSGIPTHTPAHFHYSKSNVCSCRRSGGGGRCRDQNAPLLSLWRHSEHGIEDGIHKPGYEQPETRSRVFTAAGLQLL